MSKRWQKLEEGAAQGGTHRWREGWGGERDRVRAIALLLLKIQMVT